MLKFLHVFQLRLVDLRRKRWSREKIPTKFLNPWKIQPTGRNFWEFSPLFPSGTVRRGEFGNPTINSSPSQWPRQSQDLLEGFSWIEKFQLGIFSLKSRKIFPIWEFALNLGFLIPKPPSSLRNPWFSSFPTPSYGGSSPPPPPLPKGKVLDFPERIFQRILNFPHLGKIFCFVFFFF